MIRLPVSRYTWPLLAILAVLVLARCGKDNPTRPQPPAPKRITISPASPTLDTVGQKTTLQAEVRDQNNRIIADPRVTWTSGDPNLAAVSQAGVVTALGPGTARITATSGTVSAGVGVSITTSNTDREVLIALYNATGGTSWKNNENWLSDKALGTWYGVGTDSEGRVSNLNLSENNLTGTIPAKLGQLTSLTNLILDENTLTGSISAELGNLTNLEDLYLNDNRLTGSIPAELGGLSNLQVFNLSLNTLSGPIPAELGKLTSLTVLNLSGNNLTGSIPSALGQLTSLERLNLGNNALLSGALPISLTNLPLKVLWLSYTRLCAPDTAEFQAWLATIEAKYSIINCRVFEVDALRAFYNATGGPGWKNNENWLSDTPLSDWHGVTTGSDGTVAGLDLEANNLKGSVPSEIVNFNGLTTLNLAFNPGLVGPLPRELTESKLEVLNLEGTNVCRPNDEDLQTWLMKFPGQTVAQCDAQYTNSLIALAGFYNATNGPKWTNSTNWLSQEPLGAWYGVTVDIESGVTALDLSDNNLSGSLPSALGGLAGLKVLNVSDNPALLGPLPISLSRLSLDTLNLSGTSLCVPSTEEYQTWIDEIPNTSGVTTCADAHPDWEALVALYNKTNGPNWNNNTNWLSAQPLDEWFGVTTGDDGRVISLKLSQNTLSGPIPSELGQLTSLTSMTLSKNSLTGSIPAELGGLTSVTGYLDLSWNSLTGSIPAELGQLTSLAELNLSGNILTGSIPSELGQLIGLKNLDMGGNNLTGSIPGELGQLTGLTELNLSWNSLSGSIPAELGQLTSLTDLGLSWNSLSGSIPGELGQLTSLADLNLSRNSLTGSIPAELGQLTSLTSFELYWNSLTGSIPAELGRMTNLTYLDLEGNSLTGSIPAELGQLTGLEVLYLNDNDLDGSIPSELGEMAGLRELYLAGNTGLSGPLPAGLTRLSKLESLMLGDTQLCAPNNTLFKTWLGSIQNVRVSACATPVKATAYLTQATQSLFHPVPLVAGEDALLRIFLKSDEEIDLSMIPVQVEFFNGGSTVYMADVSGEDVDVPTAFDENVLSSSINVSVPGSILRPGLEAVIEIGPSENLNNASGIARRIPETGRMSFDVRELPTLDLTMVPFLWAEGPDVSVLSAVDGLTPESELMRPTHDFLPIGDLQLTAHSPVWTSSDPVSDNVDALGPELDAIYAVEGETGYYMGIFRLRGPGGGLQGIAWDIPSFLSLSILDPYVIAHELGHNLNLFHAPCGGAGGPDPFFPYDDGSIGTPGYDLRTGSLVNPDTADLMSYCLPAWISDYSFTRALNHRMAEGAMSAPAAVAARGLLLWGGLNQEGDLFLEPAFAVEAPPALPRESGPYRLTGEREDGGELFTLSFAVSEYTDAEGGGSFAFIVPVRADWPGNLDRITLSGPEGFDMIDRESDRHYALMRDAATGEVRGILRDWADPSDSSAAGRRVPPEPGLDIVTSNGIPDF